MKIILLSTGEEYAVLNVKDIKHIVYKSNTTAVTLVDESQIQLRGQLTKESRDGLAALMEAK